MNNTISYKNYVGSVEFSEADNLFFGSVQGIKSLISYEGSDAATLVSEFHKSIDEYLETCLANNIEPEKAYKGSFNIRISPELHKCSAIYAINHQITLNSLVENAIREYVSKA